MKYNSYFSNTLTEVNIYFKAKRNIIHLSFHNLNYLTKNKSHLVKLN